MRIKQFDDMRETVEEVLREHYPVNGIVLKLRELSSGRVGYARALFGNGWPVERGLIAEWNGVGPNPPTHEVLESIGVTGGNYYIENTVEFDPGANRMVPVHTSPTPRHLRWEKD